MHKQRACVHTHSAPTELPAWAHSAGTRRRSIYRPDLLAQTLQQQQQAAMCAPSQACQRNARHSLAALQGSHRHAQQAAPGKPRSSAQLSQCWLSLCSMHTVFGVYIWHSAFLMDALRCTLCTTSIATFRSEAFRQIQPSLLVLA